jgi:hypothetical protein
MEEKQKEIESALRIIKDSGTYTNLALNEDFITWKTKIVDPRIEAIKTNILHVKRDQDGWQAQVEHLIGVYQELTFVFDTIFMIQEKVEEKARHRLKELQAD